MDGVDISSIDMVQVARQLQNIKKKCAGTPLRIYQHPDLSFDAPSSIINIPRALYFMIHVKHLEKCVSYAKGNIILSPLCFLPSLGNVKKESFAAIWNGERLKSCAGTQKNKSLSCMLPMLFAV